VIAAILEKQPLPSKPDSPAQLQWIIGKALRKDKDDRYQTLKEMLSDLKHVQHELEGRALSSAEYLIGKIKRHKAIAAGALGALLLALAGIAYFHPRERAIESVAVLPFVNVSADPRTEYLSDGITESLIDALSRSSNLKVINRNSVFRYKVREPQSVDPDPREVGLALGVQAVLTGRIVQSADGLFISAELVDTRDNSHLWGEQYNSKKLSDIFAVQKEISRDIAQKLRLRLAGETGRGSEKRHTDNIKAFENYTMGRAYLHRRTREDLLNAVRYYENAIKEDNNYARAHAGLADAYANLTARGYMAPLEGRKKIREAAEKALALDENLAEAHIAQSLKYLAAPYDFPEGERELRRAIELNPNLGTAHLYMSLSLMRQGRFEEGLDEMLKAREVDPLSPIIGRQVSLSYHLKRDYVRALEVLKRANELGPPFSSTNEIGIYVQLRLFTEALEELDKAKRERKDDPILIYSAGILHAAQGKRPEALEVVKELERLSGTDLTQAQWIAKIYAALNEKDLSFAWLERGLAAGSIVSFYKDEPVWDTLRGDSRFPDLLRRMGIP
jgi:TolB-like protein